MWTGRRILKLQKLYMKEFLNKKVILWDFDGVILNSTEVREMGFVNVLSSYPEEQVKELLKYHKENGGLSRYVKFRYFITEILNEPLNDKKVDAMSSQFSEIMKTSLGSNDQLIDEVINFIGLHFQNFNMHIVSGSDGEELRFLCDKLNISNYFKSIQGSPEPKISLVKNILSQYNYEKPTVCLVGDSINDFDAANQNQIDFFAYNNKALKLKGLNYIDSFL